MKKNTLFITGCSGYIGAMLVDQFSEREDVEKIIGIDLLEPEELIKGNPKFVFIKANLGDDSWQESVKKYEPNIVIHSAWQIREMYGNRKEQYKRNIIASKNVFNFAFENSFVERLIHFSTVASYGAFPENEIDEVFTEENELRKTDYSYAEEKRKVEEFLCEKVKEIAPGGRAPKTFIIRPASITGPRGRFMRVKFGLQSALSGQLKDDKSIWHKFISLLLSVMPITKKWCRQFIHEDDINDITEMLSFENIDSDFEIFNACPPGEVVRGEDMAKAVNKKTITLHPRIFQVGFFLARHLSLGKVPTSRGGWKTYSYPIVVDGSKITKTCEYHYKANPYDAFTKKEGRYAKYL